ncbi:MAG: ATP-binding protein [Nitrosopumilus sp.]|nr:ATP-binding protein [Nitrosopumilus sp.]
MKISLVIIAVMFGVSLTFSIVGLITFDLSVQEIKKLLGSRNEGFAFNMMQGLDKHTEKRITGFQDLTNLSLIHAALINSNEDFKKILDIKEYLNIKDKDIEFSETTPFIGSDVDEALTGELRDIIEFYRDEYNYDVVEELFVTNAHGANVALATGTSDYSHSDEEWWQIANSTGQYLGKLEFNEIYDGYSIDFAFRVNDENGNILGILRVLISLEDILSEFSEEANVISIPGRTVLLLDAEGYSIFSDEKILKSNSTVPFFAKISQEHDSGYIEIEDIVDDLQLISYAHSTGYKTFEGFGWTVLVKQDSSSIVQEFVELRDSILLASILGMIASVIGGVFIASTISAPIKRLTKAANSISRGNFDVHIKKSKIDEIKTIGNSLERMAIKLKKLIETEKQLAELHVKIKNERLAAIGELAASMAHDMKNPLGIIKSSAEILQKNKHGGELNEVVNRMNRAIDRMSHQINDVLNYVRITPLEMTSVEVIKLLETAKNSLTIPTEILFSITGPDFKIKGDAPKLEIVFINIFLNAIQSIGNKKGKIECKISKEGSNVRIEIIDSGSGIPEKILPKIFEPLITSKQNGTGLGLSTCKNIIELHHGTITAQNNPTRFTVELPILS